MCPFGVPHVRSSIPEVAMRPVGRLVEDIVRCVVPIGIKCLLVCRILEMGGRNMRARKRIRRIRKSRRIYAFGLKRLMREWGGG